MVIEIFIYMLGELDKQMMLNFLEKAYPVSRVKYNMRFKRGIILDCGVYLLGDELQKKALHFKLSEIISLVFDCDSVTSSAIVNCFLKIK